MTGLFLAPICLAATPIGFIVGIFKAFTESDYDENIDLRFLYPIFYSVYGYVVCLSPAFVPVEIAGSLYKKVKVY